MTNTARLGLRMIEPGQLQKEIAHNEALERLDMIVRPTVISSVLTSPPTQADTGDCYLVASPANGEWEGKERNFAMMGSGGWVYLEPFEGLSVRDLAAGTTKYFDGTDWQQPVHRGGVEDGAGNPVVGARQSAVALPTGGSVQDTEARSAIAMLISRLQAHGLIASN